MAHLAEVTEAVVTDMIYQGIEESIVFRRDSHTSKVVQDILHKAIAEVTNIIRSQSMMTGTTMLMTTVMVEGMATTIIITTTDTGMDTMDMAMGTKMTNTMVDGTIEDILGVGDMDMEEEKGTNSITDKSMTGIEMDGRMMKDIE